MALSCAAQGPQAIVRSASGEVRFDVELAETPGTRERGLMGRPSLPPGSGMVFLWTEETDSSFYMRDTLIPLDAAFFDGDGRILHILQMTPCAADPCPLYSPGVRYRGALEVNAGILAAEGVRVGDRIEVRR